MLKKVEFKESVEVSKHYIRSVNLNTDLSDLNLLKNYVLQSTSIQILQSLAHHINSTKQGAFTLTGPYGTGKSSLAFF